MGDEKHQPWLKWYPADWRADPPLRMCSLAARGLWIEMLGFMHEAEPYGHLLVSGLAPSIEDLASLVGTPVAVTRKALAELESRNVFSRTDAGTIYSRKMVRDKAKAEQDKANGKRGGNPKIKEPDNGGVNPQDKAQIPEARSQSEERENARAAVTLHRGWQPAPETVMWMELRCIQKPKQSAMIEHFVEHHIGKGTTFADPDAAFRTWVIRNPQFDPDRHGSRNPGPNRQGAGGVMEAAARVIARREGGAGV